MTKLTEFDLKGGLSDTAESSARISSRDDVEMGLE